MKYDFSSVGDVELLKMQIALNMELEAKMTNMIMDGELELIYDKLDEIEEQKDKRGL